MCGGMDGCGYVCGYGWVWVSMCVGMDGYVWVCMCVGINGYGCG